MDMLDWLAAAPSPHHLQIVVSLISRSTKTFACLHLFISRMTNLFTTWSRALVGLRLLTYIYHLWEHIYLTQIVLGNMWRLDISCLLWLLSENAELLGVKIAIADMAMHDGVLQCGSSICHNAPQTPVASTLPNVPLPKVWLVAHRQCETPSMSSLP